MDVKSMNEHLLAGSIDRDDMWPRVQELESKAVSFRFSFGLDSLPVEPGLIAVRGPRQYGKSTWLDLELRGSIVERGAGSAFYLNGDDLLDDSDFERSLLEVEQMFPKSQPVRRIFVDEITAVPSWERVVKRLWDRGHLRSTLLVTTGSRSTDLRRGSEKLPGRKGRLPRTEYVFLPIAYTEFHANCHQKLGDKTWLAYLLAGGSPLALNDIFQFERLPEYLIQMTRDWIHGELVSSGRSRIFLSALVRNLFRFGGTPCGYAKLARESGLANNTVASGYIEQLGDLLCVLPAWKWDERDVLNLRVPCKFHFINLLAAVSLFHEPLRHVHDLEVLDPAVQGLFLEWLVAQEVFRRTALTQPGEAESLGYWQSKTNEIDFVTPDRELIEVKRGKASPSEFTWFASVFPKRRLTVVCSMPFETDAVRGVTIEQFLLEGPGPTTMARPARPSRVASFESS
jgi:uncharacterized protein